MKDELTSGMPENIELILFAFWYLGIFKKIIKVEFPGTALEQLLRACSTLRFLASRPVEMLSFIFMSLDVLVRIGFSHIFSALNFYLN